MRVGKATQEDKGDNTLEPTENNGNDQIENVYYRLIVISGIIQ